MSLPAGAYWDGRRWAFYCMTCDVTRYVTTRASVRRVAAAHRHSHPYLDLVETQVDLEAFYPL